MGFDQPLDRLFSLIDSFFVHPAVVGLKFQKYVYLISSVITLGGYKVVITASSYSSLVE
jgi:hypothetical protein